MREPRVRRFIDDRERRGGGTPWPSFGNYRLMFKRYRKASILETGLIYFRRRWDRRSTQKHHLRKSVAYTRMPSKAEICTDFLVLDHGLPGVLPPVLFETMIFGGGRWVDRFQARYCTWGEAVRGHQRAIQRCRAHLRYRANPLRGLRSRRFWRKSKWRL